jgi:hypothetical protein
MPGTAESAFECYGPQRCIRVFEQTSSPWRREPAQRTRTVSLLHTSQIISRRSAGHRHCAYLLCIHGVTAHACCDDAVRRIPAARRNGPMDVFHEANRMCGAMLNEQHLVAPSPGPVLCSNGVAVGTTECLPDVRTLFDTAVVPGGPLIGSGREHHQLVDSLRVAGRSVQRLASTFTYRPSSIGENVVMADASQKAQLG